MSYETRILTKSQIGEHLNITGALFIMSFCWEKINSYGAWCCGMEIECLYGYMDMEHSISSEDNTRIPFEQLGRPFYTVTNPVALGLDFFNT